MTYSHDPLTVVTAGSTAPHQPSLLRPPLSSRQKRGALLAGAASGLLVSLFGLGVGAAVLIVGFVMDVGETVSQAAPVAIVAALVLMAAAWFAAWGILRGHGVVCPRAVTSWSLAIVVVVSALSSVLAGLLAFVFSALSFVFTMSGDALGLIVVLAALGAAVPTLLAGLLAVPGLSRAYRPALSAHPLSSSAPPVPAAPPVRI